MQIIVEAEVKIYTQGLEATWPSQILEDWEFKIIRSKPRIAYQLPNKIHTENLITFDLLDHFIFKYSCQKYN